MKCDLNKKWAKLGKLFSGKSKRSVFTNSDIMLDAV